MIGWTPSWYHPLQSWLEPSAPFMIALAAVLAGVGLYLIGRQEWPLLAAYLTYLIMP